MKQSRSQRALGRLLPTLVLVASAIFFAFPLLAMARFAFQNLQVIDLGWNNLFDKWSFSSVTASFSDDFFAEALTLSLKLAVGTALFTLGLLVPTAVWVHLRLPKARVFVEFLTILPYVIPAIALVAGIVVVKPHARWFLNSDYSLIPFYVVLALPFTYRSIDTGLRAIDLKVLVEASRSLGSTWIATLFRVVIPNLRAAIISSTFLTVAVVLGEYTISDVLLKRTFPSFMAQYRQSDPRGGYALAILALLGTTLLFVAIGVLSKSRSTRPQQVSRSQENEILV
jgi:putative spermidine/putrescine transport system permease protein